MVNVRLLSICPPDALRPYYQEGYLAGTDESTIDFHSKEEFDFNSRLIAKFIIPNKAAFWGKGFSAIPEIALYPKGDKIERLCKDLGKELGTEANPGKIGLFLQAWVGLESLLLSLARTKSDKIFSVLEALRVLQTKEVLDGAILKRIDHARRFRNTLVHTPDKIQSGEISLMRQTIDDLTRDIKTVAS